MIHVDTIKNGLVIDHIRAGSGPRIFHGLVSIRPIFSCDDYERAFKNTWKKDIIKIDSIISIDYSVLGFIDPNITINVVVEERITRKINLTLPDRVENIIACKNPRCITSTEKYITHVFTLVDKNELSIVVNIAMSFIAQG